MEQVSIHNKGKNTKETFLKLAPINLVLINFFIIFHSYFNHQWKSWEIIETIRMESLFLERGAIFGCVFKIIQNSLNIGAHVLKRILFIIIYEHRFKQIFEGVSACWSGPVLSQNRKDLRTPPSQILACSYHHINIGNKTVDSIMGVVVPSGGHNINNEPLSNFLKPAFDS